MSARAFLVIVPLLAVAATPEKNAMPGLLAREASSSAETWTTADGRRITHTVNRRFSFVTTHRDRTGGEVILLGETFDRRLDSGAEGEKSSVEVEASATSGKRLWTLRTEGGSGEARDDNVYRITRPGCCGAQNLSLFFSLLDGRALFSADSEVRAVEVPNTAVRRFAGYHDLMAASPVPGAGKDVHVVGALFWGSDRAPAERLLVISSAADPNESYAAKSLALVSAGKDVAEDPFVLWSADKSTDPGRIGGFSIRVRAFTEPDDLLFEVPVEADRLALEKATLGKGITLRR
ncbi:MAG TPA: hypothetical protein VFL12_10665 [Thermoanaerobaculia bacterium]|nr:hypothetical protein [Thermoanaerobaculia bacterium]